MNSTKQRNKFNAMSKSPFVKSMDGFGYEDSSSKLPMINNSSRNAPVKSPVMSSIRMSKQNQSKVFASMQKYK